MAYVLNVAYVLLLIAAAPYLLYSRIRHGKYRDGWRQKLWGDVPRRRSRRTPCLWLHAVSVGEVNLLQPLIARWEKSHPDWEIVISTTTQTGYALAQKRYAPRMIFYAPLDFTWSVETSLRIIRPTILVLAELELWPNWIAAAQRAGTKVAVINGRLSAKSFRGYSRIAGWLHSTLAAIDLVAVQNTEYAERFVALGAPAKNVCLTGSMKFDGASMDRGNPATRKLSALAGIQDSDVVLLAGSTQAPEEQIALDVFQKLSPQHPNLKLLITPRHPERFDEVAALLDRSGVRWQRRSRLETAGSDPLARVLLIDVVGELGAWWGACQIAFVGGSLGRRGGQNMIEPAAYGAAISFGPNTWNFKDVVQLLLGKQAAIVVRDAAELQSFVARCLVESTFASHLGQRAKELVLQQQGATDRTVTLLETLAAKNLAPTLPAHPSWKKHENKRRAG
ncbi:3-deoxy-D-manno-octulosonic acid transferase [Anatilimnocola aggregata]|uniref:3-deoxy-D-manno-octulosonic acid transferase n=1 Tax=Anatilimnocola aggregata TaxID=2528021 RepID=A0A517YAP0_9BACT|nr:3-deoxy-D-manno-octulosonic acid transferase [Anatilimnocola aggregata]QDU27261.1 3-deoxy-D-manno-octulosonic acid transferase [Anatilimnocola aggregata]